MLDAVDALLSDFERRGIAYCHWKSNERVTEALRAEQDLDILCSRADAHEVRSTLSDNGFRRFEDTSLTRYPFIENHVGFDSATGRLIHVHLHFELTVGTPYLKEYVPPWGSYVLERRRRDPDTGVYVSPPSVELALLFLRYSLKIRRWNRRTRRSYFAEFREEFDWLEARADDDVTAAVERLAGEQASEHVERLLRTGPTASGLARLGVVTRDELRPYSTYGRFARVALPLARKGYRGAGKLNSVVVQAPRPFRRYDENGGSTVALVGIDGSGKSTQAHRLRAWLEQKVDVHTVYFGSGDGRSSMLRAPLKYLHELRTKCSNLVDATQGRDWRLASRIDADDPDDDVGPAKALWAVLLAREKSSKRARAARARSRGMVVVMDRYPQSQVPGHSDGPLLAPWLDSTFGPLRRIARWEHAIYDAIQEHSPDVVVKLRTPPEIAADRKPGTPIGTLQRKARAIDELEFPNSSVVVIDTDRDEESVQHRLREAVWDAM